MKTPPFQTFKKYQLGQAMVEYAILLTVMVTLIAGGVELGLAAFNSNRTAEGAKAGAALWSRNGMSFAVSPNSSGISLIYDGTTYPNMPFLDHTVGPRSSRYRSADYQSGSGESWGIGDHSWTDTDAIDGTNPQLFYNPTCHQAASSNQVSLPAGVANDHFIGLPDDAAPEDLNHELLDPTSTNYDPNRQRVYLFNPLPIDITECVDDLDKTDDYDPYAEFINGRKYLAVATGTPGEYVSANGVEYTEYYLPPVNRAILSLYVRECVSASVVIDCTDQDNPPDRVYLRLPGGRHVGDDPRNMTQLGLFEEGSNSYSISTSKGQEDGSGNVTGLLDSFRMHCRLEGVDNVFPEPTDPDNCRTLCYGQPDRFGDVDTAGDNYTDYGPGLPCDVRVIIRHRHIFESLVMMTGWKKSVAVDSRQFTDSPFVDDSNPNQISRGILGTEVTRGFVLKPQKTFRGCYETSSAVNKRYDPSLVVGGDPETGLAGGNSVEITSCN